MGRYQKEVIKYLVQWKGYGPEWNEWVREDDILVNLIKEYKQLIGEPLGEEGDGDEN